MTNQQIIKELREEYGLSQGKGANVTDDGNVIFTPRDTLTLEKMAEIISEYLEENNHQLLKKKKGLKLLIESHENLKKRGGLAEQGKAYLKGLKRALKIIQ